MRVLVLIIAATVYGCTIAPKVSEPARVSPWVQANVISYDLTGYIVKPDWVRAYHSMLKTYGDKLPIPEQVPADDMTGITPRGSNYHITFLVNRRFTDLQYIEKHAPGT